MNKPKYTEEEIELIKEWAIADYYEMEKKGHRLGSSKTPVTVLEMALRRKEAVAKAKQRLKDEIY